MSVFFLSSEINKRPIYSLILAGGKSTRMGVDKAILKFQDKLQIIKIFELLKLFHEHTLISCRKDQGLEKILPLNNDSFIFDKFIGYGPMGGILSAQEKFKDAAFFVVACDMPFLDSFIIENLITNRDPFKIGTFYRVNDSFEPLCSIYEPKSRFLIFDYLIKNNLSLNKMIRENLKFCKSIEINDQKSLKNINYPEEYATHY